MTPGVDSQRSIKLWGTGMDDVKDAHEKLNRQVGKHVYLPPVNTVMI